MKFPRTAKEFRKAKPSRTHAKYPTCWDATRWRILSCALDFNVYVQFGRCGYLRNGDRTVLAVSVSLLDLKAVEGTPIPNAFVDRLGEFLGHDEGRFREVKLTPYFGPYGQSTTPAYSSIDNYTVKSACAWLAGVWPTTPELAAVKVLWAVRVVIPARLCLRPSELRELAKAAESPPAG